MSLGEGGYEPPDFLEPPRESKKPLRLSNSIKAAITPRPARAPSTPPAIAPALLLFDDGFDVGEPDDELDVEDGVEVASNEAENEVVGNVVLGNVVKGYDMVVMRPVSVDKVELSVDVKGSVGLVDVVSVIEKLLEAVSCADVNTWRSRRMAIKKQ